MVDNVEWERVRAAPLFAAVNVFSAAENVILHPLWLLKTREQNERTKLTNPFKNGINVARKIYASQGIRGFYQGFVSNTIGSGPVYAGYVWVYQYSKHKLNQSEHDYVRALSPTIAGIAAEMASLTVWNPIDIVTQRMALPGSPYKSSIQVVRDIWKHERVAGFYRGLGITAITYGIGSGAWWSIYEYTKPSLQRQFPDWHPAGSQAVAGAIAGVGAAIISNPFDVVKTRMQSHPGHTLAAQSQTHQHALPQPQPERYRNAWHGMSTMAREEGYAAFTRGLPTRMLQRAPMSGLSAIVYELIMKVGTVSQDLPADSAWPMRTAWQQILKDDSPLMILSRKKTAAVTTATLSNNASSSVVAPTAAEVAEIPTITNNTR